MFPNPSRVDVRDSAFTNGEHFADDLLFRANTYKAFYFLNIGFCKLCSPVTAADRERSVFYHV